MAHILILTPDIPPIGEHSASGGSLRAWGIGEGLKSCGHNIQYAITTQTALRHGYKGEQVLVYAPTQLNEFLDKIAPDIALFTHWPMLADLSQKPSSYVVLDFHGPLLIENLFHAGPQSVQSRAPHKIDFLSRADFFTCAGCKQMPYFLAWLLMAGIDLREFSIPIIPFSLSPMLPALKPYTNELSFVYGGTLQPWQDPSLGLQILTEELTKQQMGKLSVYGGKNGHPLINERFEKLQKDLTYSDRVHFIDTLAREDLINEYLQSSIAWDIMSCNAERQIAFTSRTVEYLWCGLPVVYNNYSELTDYIQDFDAGWIVDPADAAQIRATLKNILKNPELIAVKSKNAQKLVRERLTWNLTIKPLDNYCRSPYRAPRISEQPLLESSQSIQWLRKKASRLTPSRIKKLLKHIS